jgi:SAM-dependent methyltransferase
MLDVGCRPGALTTEMVTRFGAGSVSAIDPSESFVAAARERHPGIEVQRAMAEALPYPDDVFDAALAARRSLHARPCRGLTRDGPRDAQLCCVSTFGLRAEKQARAGSLVWVGVLRSPARTGLNPPVFGGMVVEGIEDFIGLVAVSSA